MNRQGEKCTLIVTNTNLPAGVIKRQFEDYVRQAILMYHKSLEPNDPKRGFYSVTTVKQFNL